MDRGPAGSSVFLIDPQRVARWLDVPQTWEARAGGNLRIAIDGVHPVVGQFVQVEVPRRLVFTWGWEQPDYGVPPGGSRVEIDLTPDGDGTRVTVQHVGLPGDPDVHARGWMPYLTRLAIAVSATSEHSGADNRMGERGRELAAMTQDALDGMAALIEGCSDAEWRQTCSGEGWPVAVTAHHIASSSGPLMDFVELVANGQPLPPISLDMIHDMNAKHAHEFADCTRDEILDLLQADGSKVVARIAALSDEQLARTAQIPLFGENPTSAQTLIEILLIGHPREHGGSIKATLGK